MYQRQLTRLLFTPSLLSGATISLIVLGSTGRDIWAYVRGDQQFDGLFSGAYGLDTYLSGTSASFSAWYGSFSQSSLMYYLVVLAAASLVGLGIFALLQLGGVVRSEGRKVLVDGTVDTEYRREVLARLGLRSLSLAGWALYAAFCASMIWPFVLLLNEQGLVSVFNNVYVGVWYSVASVVLGIVTLHIHVIFMRLVALRPRLFGGLAVIEDAEADNSHMLQEP